MGSHAIWKSYPRVSVIWVLQLHNFSKLHEKSCYLGLIIYMKKSNTVPKKGNSVQITVTFFVHCVTLK